MLQGDAALAVSSAGGTMLLPSHPPGEALVFVRIRGGVRGLVALSTDRWVRVRRGIDAHADCV
eukprot:5484341-Pyramimonas_sp.AAC.1